MTACRAAATPAPAIPNGPNSFPGSLPAALDIFFSSSIGRESKAWGRGTSGFSSFEVSQLPIADAMPPALYCYCTIGTRDHHHHTTVVQQTPITMSSKPSTGRKRRRGSPVHELATHGGKPLLFQDDNTGRKRVNTSALRFVVDAIQDETGKTISSVASELVNASEKVCVENALVAFDLFSATLHFILINCSLIHHHKHIQFIATVGRGKACPGSIQVSRIRDCFRSSAQNGRSQGMPLK